MDSLMDDLKIQSKELEELILEIGGEKENIHKKLDSLT